MNTARIRRVLQVKQLLHPELARSLTWNSLRQVMRREDVEIVTRAISTPARLLGFGGSWAIFVNSETPPRRHTYYAAHEIGHLWLHVDDADGRHACVYNFDDPSSPDPREDEAEHLAAWLLGDDSVRSFLDVPASPLAVAIKSLPPIIPAAALGRRVERRAEVRPEPAPPREPERVRVMQQRIEDVDDVDALYRVRREVLLAFDRDPWMRVLVNAISRREDELLEDMVHQSRQRSSTA